MTRRPDGYWTLGSTLAECRKLVKKYRELPSHDKLVEMKMSYLTAAVKDNGGFNKIREILGLEIRKKSNGYWTLENTLAECRNLVEEYGELPGSDKLKEIDRGDLGDAITNNGGYVKIRNKLGLESKRNKQKPDGYWNLENTIAECKKLVKEYGELPGSDKFYKMKMSYLTAAVKDNGGFPKIRKMLGLKILIKPVGYWTLENTLAECRKVIEKYGKLPGSDKLAEMKMSCLSYAIGTNGGFPKIRELLGIQKQNPLKEAIMEYLGDGK